MQGKGKDTTRRDRQGMTLVEMMIALTVFGMIMAVVMGFLVGGIVLAVFLPIFKIQQQLAGG